MPDLQPEAALMFRSVNRESGAELSCASGVD